MNTRTPFDEMNRFFDQFRGDTFEWPTVREGSEMDLHLTMERIEDSYVVLADLPGFEREEIDLTLEDGLLELHATHEVDGETHYRSRTAYDRITIPDDVDTEGISATYSNGVLEITLPATTEKSDSGHRIDIE